jgi:phosphoglucosamine mutase
MRIGQALGEFIRARSDHPVAVMGYDTRYSSSGFMNELSTGMMGQGVDVINLGIITTPGVAFITRRNSAHLGVIVSASHSPLEYNGIKLVGANGLRLSREEEIEIESLIERFIEAPPNFTNDLGQEVDGQHLVEIYIDEHVKSFSVASLKGFRAVLDCAHGATTSVGPEVFRRVGCEVDVIHDSPDGKNINHRSGSEHARENPDELAKAVQQWDASYGFAFDGDGDRLVVVDRTGKIYDGQDLLYVFGMHYKKTKGLKNNVIVTTRLSNQGLEDSLNKLGIQVMYANKGDRNLESTMWGGDYLLGGEIGGNIIINDGNHTAADGVYTALVLAGILAQNQDVSLNEMTAQLTKYPQEIISFFISEELSQSQRYKIEENIHPLVLRLGTGGRILFWESSTEHQVFRVLVEGGANCPREVVTEIVSTVQQIIRQQVG